MVKRYDISCFGGMHMDECGDGAYVNYEDYAELESKLETALRECRSAGITIDNLEAKCAALESENAGMKVAIDATIGWQQSTDPENVESVRMLLDLETPSTDSFLAEVRAQGVEMAMEHMQSSGSLTFGDCYISLNEFAAKLRQEADK